MVSCFDNDKLPEAFHGIKTLISNDLDGNNVNQIQIKINSYFTALIRNSICGVDRKKIKEAILTTKWKSLKAKKPDTSFSEIDNSEFYDKAVYADMHKICRLYYNIYRTTLYGVKRNRIQQKL